MLTVTVVRHGESTDNLKPLWAGWQDAPLSVHGMNQARALGASFKSTTIDAIYASDLLRAHWTAQQIERNQVVHRTPLTTSQLLREQHFGVAEGKPFGGEGFTRQPGRKFRFQDGESLEDVRERANAAIHLFIEPHIKECQGRQADSRHIVIVAHGIFNSEFIGALLARRTDSLPANWGYKGMTNTGWTRLIVGYAVESTQTSTVSMATSPIGPIPPSAAPSEPPPHTLRKGGQEPLTVSIVSTDVTKHLDGVVRQKGGVGSSGYDEKQKDIRTFFGGGP